MHRLVIIPPKDVPSGMKKINGKIIEENKTFFNMVRWSFAYLRDINIRVILKITAGIVGSYRLEPYEIRIYVVTITNCVIKNRIFNNLNEWR